MKSYQIHIMTKSGRKIISDPITEPKVGHKQMAEMLDDMVEIVGNGGYITMLVNKTRKAYMHSAIEEMFWTVS